MISNLTQMKTNELTGLILDCAFETHTELGPGLYESVYETCLEYEFQENGLLYHRQKPINISYRGKMLDAGFRADFMVEDKVIVEIKAVETLSNLHLSQMLTYLKLTNREIGLLINFNVQSLRFGIKRVLNKYYTGESDIIHGFR